MSAGELNSRVDDRNRRSKRRCVGILAGMFGFLLLASESVALADRLEPWTGLIHEDAISILPRPHAQGDEPWPFLVGILDGEAQYDSFRATAGDTLPPDVEIDWQSELMIYAIWPRHTNDMGLVSWEAPEDGTGVLNIGWSAIEPFYFDRFPALIHTVPRDGLTKLDFILDDVPIAVVPGFEPLLLASQTVPEPTSIVLLLLSVVALLLLRRPMMGAAWK